MSVDALNVIDIILAVVLLFSTILGLARGLVRGVFGILGLIVGFIVARKYGHLFAESLITLLGESAMSAALGYAFSFVGVVVVFAILTRGLQRLIAFADLGILDSFGGMLFGGMRGAIFCMVISAFIGAMPVDGTDAWKRSVLLPVFGTMIESSLVALAPPQYMEYWEFDGGRPRIVIPHLSDGGRGGLQSRGERVEDLQDLHSRPAGAQAHSDAAGAA